MYGGKTDVVTEKMAEEISLFVIGVRKTNPNSSSNSNDPVTLFSAVAQIKKNPVLFTVQKRPFPSDHGLNPVNNRDRKNLGEVRKKTKE